VSESTIVRPRARWRTAVGAVPSTAICRGTAVGLPAASSAMMRAACTPSGTPTGTPIERLVTLAQGAGRWVVASTGIPLGSAGDLEPSRTDPRAVGRGVGDAVARSAPARGEQRSADLDPRPFVVGDGHPGAEDLDRRDRRVRDAAEAVRKRLARGGVGDPRHVDAIDRARGRAHRGVGPEGATDGPGRCAAVLAEHAAYDRRALVAGPDSPGITLVAVGAGVRITGLVRAQPDPEAPRLDLGEARAGRRFEAPVAAGQERRGSAIRRRRADEQLRRALVADLIGARVRLYVCRGIATELRPPRPVNPTRSRRPARHHVVCPGRSRRRARQHPPQPRRPSPPTLASLLASRGNLPLGRVQKRC
jgi:hypothetical protein